MNYQLRLASTFLCFIVMPCLVMAASVQKLTNEKVSVTEITLLPGQTETLADSQPSLILYLEGKLALLDGDGQPGKQEEVRRGETEFLSPQAHTIKNTGTSPLSLARIAFLGPGSKETWGTTGLAPNYKLLSENRYARTYDIKIPAASKEPLHTHHDRVVICLSGATLEHILPDGRTQPSTLKTGEIAWRSGQTHVGHNIGNTNLWVIAVEPK